MKIKISTISILLLICYTAVADAKEASALCVSEFDGLVSKSESKCESRIDNDKAYRDKQQAYLYSKYPKCYEIVNDFIHGEIEEKCVSVSRLDEDLDKKTKFKILARLFPQCDGVDRKGVIHQDKVDGILAGFPEKMCGKKAITKNKIEYADMLKEDTAKLDEENAKLDEDIAEGKERIRKAILKLIDKVEKK